MSIVAGINWVGLIYDGGIWKPYVCARSGNFNIETGTIETSVTGSGNYKTFEPTVHGFTVQLDGVVSLVVAGSVSIADLQTLQLNKTKLLWRFIMTSQAGDIYIKEAYFYITNSIDTGSFDGVATFSISMLGTGAIGTVINPPSPTTAEVFRYPAAGSTAPATPGSYTWSTGLTGKNPLEIVKDGRGQSDIILSGTPIGNEALYDPTTGDITFAVPFEDVETAPYFLYQNV